MRDVDVMPLHHRDDDFSDPWEKSVAVVMLHGFARNGEFWRSWVPSLSRHFRVVRPDLPGCGGTPRPPEGFAFDTSGFVQTIVRLVEQLGIDNFHLIGESSGGVLAATLAADMPQLVRSLALVSTPMSPAIHDEDIKSGGYASAIECMQDGGLEGWWMSTRQLGRELTGQDERDAYYARQLARTSVDVGIEIWKWIHDPSVNLEPVLPKIAAPTMLMSPGTSHGTDLEQQLTMAKLIPRCRHVTYDEYNHEMYYLHGDLLAQEARDFFMEIDDESGKRQDH